MGYKNWNFYQELKYLIERPVALIQQTDSIEQCSDV